MTIESHWRVIKHDYLHNFNHLRLDLLIHILIQKVIPRQIDRLYLSYGREMTNTGRMMLNRGPFRSL